MFKKFLSSITVVMLLTAGLTVGASSAALAATNVPTSVAVKATASTSMSVSWKKPATTSKLTGYTVQYSKSKTFASGNVNVTVSGASVVSKSITGLTPSSNYYVRVKANYTGVSTSYSSGVTLANKMVMTFDPSVKPKITLPINSSAKVWISWGDGTSAYYNNPSSPPSRTYAKTYATAKSVTITVVGYLPSFSSYPAFYGSVSNLKTVTAWGDSMGTTDANFHGAEVLTSTVQPPLTVTSYRWLFAGATIFNQDISSWNVSHVTDMQEMFFTANAFNKPLNSWNVGKVQLMACMFAGAKSFNQPLSNWNVASVVDMHCMFSGAETFNQPLNSWNTSSVVDMDRMFSYAYAFNQPLSNWNTSNVTDMYGMFQAAGKFNQPLNSWNVSKVTKMQDMFNYTYTFNQPLSNWNTSNVTDMSRMFQSAYAFNQNISEWDISSVTAYGRFHYQSGLTQVNTPVIFW